MSAFVKTYSLPAGRDRIFFILTALFLITLFIPHIQAVNSICIGAMFVYSFFVNTLREKWALLKERKAVQLMLAFFLLHIISACFSNNSKEGWELVVLRLPLLLFPATFGLIVVGEHLKRRLLLTFAVIISLVALVCMALSVHQYFTTGQAYFLYSNDLSKWVDKQSTYMASFVNVAIFCFIYLLRDIRFTLPRQILIYISIAVLTAFMFLLASRMALVAFAACALLYLGYVIIKNRSWIMALGVSGVLVAAFFVLSSFFPKTINRFTELKYTSYEFSNVAPESNYNYEFDASQWNGANIRMAIWHCGWQLAGENLLTGTGLGDKKSDLVNVYKRNNFIFGYTDQRNLHNTYLDVLVAFGVFGLALFLLAYFVLPLWGAVRSRDLLGFFILIELMWQLLPESYLDRSVGCMEMTFFIALTEGWRKVKQQPAAIVVPIKTSEKRKAIATASV